MAKFYCMSFAVGVGLHADCHSTEYDARETGVESENYEYISR